MFHDDAGFETWEGRRRRDGGSAGLSTGQSAGQLPVRSLNHSGSVAGRSAVSCADDGISSYQGHRCHQVPLGGRRVMKRKPDKNDGIILRKA